MFGLLADLMLGVRLVDKCNDLFLFKALSGNSFSIISKKATTMCTEDGWVSAWNKSNGQSFLFWSTCAKIFCFSSFVSPNCLVTTALEYWNTSKHSSWRVDWLPFYSCFNNISGHVGMLRKYILRLWWSLAGIFGTANGWKVEKVGVYTWLLHAKPRGQEPSTDDRMMVARILGLFAKPFQLSSLFLVCWP